MFVQYWPTAEETVAKTVNTLPKVVFFATLDEAPWVTGRWHGARRRGSSSPTT